ncbi:MAG: glycine cleavage system aminomethyltransferase GcvT [Planctomycetota bacterium]
MAETTPLYDRHHARGARMVDFAGYALPVQFAGVLDEHRHCRTAAALFDTSHMGQLLIRGPDAGGELAKLFTQNAAELDVGRDRYGFLLNSDGGVIDDAILMRLGEQEFLLVVNAGTADDDRQWVQSHLGGAVEITDLRADGWGKIDLQGPSAADVLAPLAEFELPALQYFRCRRGRIYGAECIVSRTGYTGELGYEIMGPGDEVAALWDRLLDDERVAPAGLGARDSLRLEMCLPLYGNELSRRRTPLEADLMAFVGDHGFIGAEALRIRARRGAGEKLVALRSDGRRRPRAGDVIRRGDRKVGTITSGAFSPMLEVSIAMGYVAPDAAEVGTELSVATRRAELGITVADKPLYKQGTARAKLE